MQPAMFFRNFILLPVTSFNSLACLKGSFTGPELNFLYYIMEGYLLIVSSFFSLWGYTFGDISNDNSIFVEKRNKKSNRFSVFPEYQPSWITISAFIIFFSCTIPQRQQIYNIFSFSIGTTSYNEYFDEVKVVEFLFDRKEAQDALICAGDLKCAFWYI